MTAVRAATALLSLLLGRVAAEKVFIPPAFHNGSVTIETDSVAGNLDGFKMRTAANRTSYDYWWFDAVSLPDKAGLNIVFYNAGDIGNPQPLAAEISGVFPNGTRFYNQVMASEGAVISNGPQGVSGDWKGTGAKFRGTNLDKPNVEYHVTFDSPGLGVDGTIQLKSPTRYPCGPNTPGQTQQHLPRFFWSNAVPDADATVNLLINGTALKLKGIGYHDKNWGDKTILESPKFWDWGHARLGPYSLVWYDLLDYDDNEYRRSYVAKDGEILVISCNSSAVTTRPWGADTTWPPAGGLASIPGVVSRFDVGNGITLVANVTKELVTYHKAVYTRAVGSFRGTIEGGAGCGQTFEGRAFYDEFTYGVRFG